MTVATGRPLSARRRVVFAIVTVAIALLVPFASLLAVDVYLHGRFEKAAALNVWGYRGPTVGRKRPGEYRVAVLGGSAAYGYGTTWDQAIPAILERELAEKSKGAGRTFRVVNLAYNNEGAYSFRFTLQDYLSLDYDLACLYEGYNDLGDRRTPNLSVFRHDSPVFRLTGYMPIFPIIFKEKAAAIVSGGDPGALYRSDNRTVFHPGITARTKAEALKLAANVGESLERQIGRMSPESTRRIVGAESTGCKAEWQQYCRSVLDAVAFARAHGKQVLVATQPYMPDEVGERHREQQAEMAAMLERRFGADPKVRYVDLGGAVDLADPALSFDRMHLTVDGNRRVGEAMVGPVLDMARLAAPDSSGPPAR